MCEGCIYLTFYLKKDGQSFHKCGNTKCKHSDCVVAFNSPSVCKDKVTAERR